MDKEYFIVVNDNRVGPLSINQLEERGIEPSTLVWTAGMADWTRADSVPELSQILANRRRVDDQESAFGAYTQQQYRQPSYQNRQYSAFNNRRNNFVQGPSVNWKVISIVATVCGFLFSCIGGIIGIFAIMQANKAENAMRTGDQFTADSSWSTCKTLCIISLVLTGIGLVLNVLYISNLSNLGIGLL